MGTFLLVLFGALLANGLRLAQDDQHLEPMDEPVDDQTICTKDCDKNVDCVYSGWGDWGPCWGVSSCGGPYFVNRSRSVLQNSIGTGTSCKMEALFDSRACNEEELSLLINNPSYQSSCAVPCIQGEWYVKEECNVGPVSCPPRAQAPIDGIVVGHKVMARNITQHPKFGGAACGKSEDVVPCHYNCVYDCQWSDWMNNGCTLPCIPPEDGNVKNLQKKFRTVQYFPVNGGKPCEGDSTKEEGPCEDMTNFPICCPGCTEGPWGEWSQCTLTCGTGGSQRRTRTVTPPSEWYSNPEICAGSMAVCGATEQMQECCKTPCPVDCSCGEWSAWSDCYSEESIYLQCGAGTKTRTRQCRQPEFGGKACPETTETVNCFLPGCPVPCEVSTWSDFSPCPASCGVRVMRTRTRTVVTEPSNGGAPCPALEDSKACPCIDCPVDCVLGAWSEWGACDSPCGPGTRTRSRDVLTVPRNGGAGCDNTVESSACVVNEQGWYQDGPVVLPANKPCDVHCQVGPWGNWSDCSKSCTSDVDPTFPGVRRRSRDVIVPPQYDGARCPKTVEEEWCNTQCCPIDMVLSDWTEWTECSMTCGGGYQYRRRTVAVYPRCGGNVIHEPLEESRVCNTHCCQRECVYHSYGTYSPCLDATEAELTAITSSTSLTEAQKHEKLLQFHPLQCPQSSGFRYRNRAVRISNPCGHCTDTWDVKPCYQTCPVDCVMYAWGKWSACSVECGYGSQRRTRTVQTEPSNGGSPCPCTEEYRPCFQGECCTECTLTPWNDWEPCSATCGGGLRNRRRFINMSTPICPEKECVKQGLMETESCNTAPCPHDCIMGGWDEWSPCSADCGLGFQFRTRPVQDFAAGGCPWSFEERPCNLGDCPIPCVYTEWSEWTPCGVSCVPASAPASVTYKQYRSKYRVSGPADDSCPPYVHDDMSCLPYPPPCEVICLVSDWGNWTGCSSPFGWGEETRIRTVTQTPTGENLCPQLQQIRRCYHEPPTNDCTFSEWQGWSECSSSCRHPDSPPPVKRRQRVLLTAPGTVDSGDGSVTLDQNLCQDFGDLTETMSCTELPFCPVDCVMTRWSPWSECLPPGVRSRTRRVYSEPAFGGAPCPVCVKETDRCNVLGNQALPEGECEVGPCLQEVEREYAERHQAVTFAV